MNVAIDRAVYANANALDLPIADRSAHMIATSPPYFGLRSYDTGDNKHAELGAEKVHDCLAWSRGDEPCGACYVCNLRAWAREMWRVLRDDGTMWLNLGDSYASGGGIDPYRLTTSGKLMPQQGRAPLSGGLKVKDLIGIPWRVALALQADGWWLRSDVIWEKPNCMPESVTDRPTKSHEYIFMLTKSARYFFDAEAVKEEQTQSTIERAAYRWNGRTDDHSNGARTGSTFKRMAQSEDPIATIPADGRRNIRTVWNIATSPYSGAHYATWPPALVERMIRAGSSERGVCPECGAPWRRVVQKGEPVNAPRNPNDVRPYEAVSGHNNGNGATTLHKVRQIETIDWQPTCDHGLDPTPAIVLDPFAGSGTTLMVARQLGRIGLGFDLSETYLRENAAVRLGHDKLAAWVDGIKDPGNHDDLPLFATNGATP